MKKVYHLLFLTLVFGVQCTSGQTEQTGMKMLTPEELQEDFKVFKAALWETHPALDRYVNKKRINLLFDSCLLPLSKPKTEIEFYAQIKYLLSALQDGHLGSRAAEELNSYFSQQALLFPVQLRFLKDKAYVVCSPSASLETGREILTINGKSVNLLRNQFFKYIMSDGTITSFKHRDVSIKFPFYYFMLYGEPKEFEVTFKDKAGDLKSTVIQAEKFPAMDCKFKYERPEKLLDFTFHDDNIAILTIRSFDYYSLRNSNENYTRFLEDTFRKLKSKGTEKLIIDLRGNGGGMDTHGSLLYAYLTNKEFSYYKSLHNADRQLTSSDHSNLLTQQARSNNFDGDVYIITDGFSFSTTAEFCAVARSNERAIFVGEETAGGYYGNNSGGSVSTTLPNSNIAIYVPTIKYILDVKPSTFPDRGIIPDHEVLPSITDIILNKDVQLEYAIELAKQN
jgi:C-terminal processing protease CtpA/Prc